MIRYNHSKPKRKRNVHVIDTEASFDEAYHQRFIAEMEQYSNQRERKINATVAAVTALIIGAGISLFIIGVIRLFK